LAYQVRRLDVEIDDLEETLAAWSSHVLKTFTYLVKRLDTRLSDHGPMGDTCRMEEDIGDDSRGPDALEAVCYGCRVKEVAFELLDTLAGRFDGFAESV
jgi:hypothetical protein